jgi:hypothetical protein
MLFNMMSLSQFPGWEGVEKGSKSENLPVNWILQPAANRVHIIRYFLPSQGVVCCKIKQLTQY